MPDCKHCVRYLIGPCEVCNPCMRGDSNDFEVQPEILIEPLKLLAELFPEENMDESDFSDRSSRIMGIVVKAKAALKMARGNK